VRSANFLTNTAEFIQRKEDTNGGSFHHRIEFKELATRRHLEEHLVEGDFSGGRSDFFLRSASRREAFATRQKPTRESLSLLLSLAASFIGGKLLTTKGTLDRTFKKFKPFKSFKTLAGLFDGLNDLNGLNYLNATRAAQPR